MWLPESSPLNRRKLLTALLAAPLGACGFTPLYGDNTKASIARGRIEVAKISGLMGFKMRERLTSKLGPATNPSHLLRVTVSVSSQQLAINPQNEITRYSLTGIAKFKLRHNAADVDVFDGDVRAFSAYSATASAYATSIAEKDARERLATTLAEQISTRISLSADRWLG